MTDSRPPAYDLSAPLVAPNLPGEVVVCDTVEELVEKMSNDLLAHSLNCWRAFGDFHMALSGGSTPLPFYRHLMTDPICRGIPWKKTHLWCVDERRVSFDDEKSNWRMIEEHFGAHSGIPRSQQHPMDALSDRVENQYARSLCAALEWRERGHDRLDYVLLGVGTDGHTASLFPRSPALMEQTRLIRINSGSTVVPPDRVTMTLPLINSARFVAVMVTGEAKQEIVGRLSANAHTTVLDLPIRGVRPIGGTLCWYLDRAAAAPAA